MSRVKALAVAGSAFLLFASLAPSAHAADPPNACADAYGRAQELRSKRKLIGARDALRVCSQQTCPAFIVKDCTSWLDEVQASLPSVVPVATDAQGNDLAGVKVSMDGEVLFESSDGRSVDVDPGRHTFTFELRGPRGDEAPPVVKHVVVAEGEKNKRIAAIVQKPGAAQAVQPAQPQYQQYPIQQQPQYQQPVQQVRPPVPVTVTGNRDDMRLQFDSFETNTHTTCTVPCAAQIPTGNYMVGIARGTGPIRNSQPVYIGGPGTVKASSVSHTGLHVAGILTLVGAIVVQIGLSADAVGKQVCDSDGLCVNATDNSELEAATVIGILGFTAGIIMIAQKNHNDVKFVPLGVGAIRAPSIGGAREGAWSASAPQGGAIQVRF